MSEKESRRGMREYRNSALRVLGMALTLAWAFCAAPPISADGTFWEGVSAGAQILIRFSAVGLVPCIIFIFAPRLFEPQMLTRSILGAAALWLAGWLGTMGVSASVPAPLLVALAFVNGIGTSFFLVFWGLALCRGDAERIERDFVLILVLVGLVVMVTLGLPNAILDGVLAAVPVAVAACALADGVVLPNEPLLRKSDGEARGEREETARATLTPLVLSVAFSVTIVSFVWCMFSLRHQELMVSKALLFGLGFMVSGLAIWLFVKYSPSVGFVAAARWVLPVMACGLLFNGSEIPELLVAACLMLSVAHAAFEMILRMQVISFARKSRGDELLYVGWGFAAIMAGAFLGPSLYMVVTMAVAIDSLHLTLVVLAVLVGASSLLLLDVETRLGRSHSLHPYEKADHPAGDEVVAAGGTSEAAQDIAERYGLTNRECEILGMLLQGRSRPYIRDTLYVSISTVDTHVRHIYAKVGVHNKQELIDLAQQSGEA
ncbi:helix-turn-helix transcriptional regulator [Adlercreutzia sp. R7]|uniref:Helix-turn-helix transcriptional regulator n=1 Tax=Adlercreutzia wanghongyangiae TaxID=3111451 RepID=A0ABU6IG23_9ACTN|nr:helix-turn-helix transcriptional regulator [Adlercreutzia sp. R7]